MRQTPSHTAGVDQFDALVSASNDGLLGHVMARSALQRVSDEIMQLVEIIDGINRYRFAEQPELLAAWDSARHVVTGPRTAEEDAEDRPASPGAGEVQPAAGLQFCLPANHPERGRGPGVSLPAARAGARASPSPRRLPRHGASGCIRGIRAS